MNIYLGIDVGSVTTKFAALDQKDGLIADMYTRTLGRPVQVVQEGLQRLVGQLPPGAQVKSVGVTGSARRLTGVAVGADVVKNEITTHAVAAASLIPEVQTVLEIGGQDSKLIQLDDGMVTDFSMNSVCAAGTGSFLDQQAYRLDLPVEEIGPLALRSRHPVRIAGRCTVFAESDMIHKQQMGHHLEDILYGLCQALARNYLNNLALGRELHSPIIFQGGVAANEGMVRAFRKVLGQPVLVPKHYAVMGAIGAVRSPTNTGAETAPGRTSEASKPVTCSTPPAPSNARVAPTCVKWWRFGWDVMCWPVGVGVVGSGRCEPRNEPCREMSVGPQAR